jgi:DNA-binding SARP family transcriptional activator
MAEAALTRLTRTPPHEPERRVSTPDGSIATAKIHRLDAARAASAPLPAAAGELEACLLGPFQVRVDGKPIADWPNRKSKAILKYLLLNRDRPVAKEVLMELLWPEADAAAARNSLNVAIHRLRRVLGSGERGPRFIVFADGHYALDPDLKVWTDADAFLAHAQRAAELERARDVESALQEYAACAALYRGELLAEDRYAEWPLPLRQQLRDRHLQVLERLSRIHFDRQDYRSCTAICTRILAVDACDEAAHRMLMRCYALSGQPHFAQRQYQACIQALARFVSVAPSAETTVLFQQLARR